MAKSTVKGSYFDKQGNIQIEKKDNSSVVNIKGAVRPNNEESENNAEIHQDRLKLLKKYSEKYPELSIEQVAELIDHPDLKSGEEYVIRKILEDENKQK